MCFDTSITHEIQLKTRALVFTSVVLDVQCVLELLIVYVVRIYV